MNAHIALPGEEQYVSSYSVESETLRLRLSSDYHEGHPSAAFELVAKGVQNSMAVEKFISNLVEHQIYIYCCWNDSHLVLTTEDGEELQVVAASYAGQPAAANLKELQKALNRVSGWLELERTSSSRTRRQLNATTALLQEQLRRIEAMVSAV